MLMESLSTFIRFHSANKEATTDDKQSTEAGRFVFVGHSGKARSDTN